MDLPHPPEMIDPPPHGRVFALPMRPLLGDCAPSGRIRLDALARWLQDVAFADIEQAGVEAEAIWVVRRTRLRVERFPRFGERVQVETFASGIGRMWAERRTRVRPLKHGEDSVAGPLTGDLASGEPPIVEAVAVWIHLDPERRVPSPLSKAEIDLYGSTAGSRRFPHRLTHPRPEHVESQAQWTFRRTDADLADHINNAAYWEPLEEELLNGALGGEELTQVEAEVEFRVPAQPGPVTVLRRGPYRWLTEPGDGEVYASTVLARAATDAGRP